MSEEQTVQTQILDASDLPQWIIGRIWLLRDSARHQTEQKALKKCEKRVRRRWRISGVERRNGAEWGFMKVRAQLWTIGTRES
jgi:hypothetical protein